MLETNLLPSESQLISVAVDTFELMDGWGPEKMVCVSDRRTGMRGVLVIDNAATY